MPHVAQIVTLTNDDELSKTILNPQEREGLRMVVTRFPQEELNLIDDRRTDLPQMGVALMIRHIRAATKP